MPTASASADLTINDTDAAVFAIKVSDNGGSTFDQDATVFETGDGTPNTGIFEISLSGVTLETGDTASVVVTVGGDAVGSNGTAMDADFTQAVIAAIIADAGTAGVAGVDNTDGTVTLTWSVGDSTTFEVDLTAAADAFPDSPETLTLSLGTALLNGSGTNASVPTASASADLTINDTDVSDAFRINEVGVNATVGGTDGVNFIELRNTNTTDSEPVSNLKIELIGNDGNISASFDLPSGVTVPTGGYIVLTENGADVDYEVFNADGTTTSVTGTISGAGGWNFGTGTSDIVGVNLANSDHSESFDTFVANGADETKFSATGVTWTPAIIASNVPASALALLGAIIIDANQTFSGSIDDIDDIAALLGFQLLGPDTTTESVDNQVFARVFFSDSDGEADWTTTGDSTAGAVNLLTSENPQDALDDFNPLQDSANSLGGQSVLIANPIMGSAGPDFLYGTDADESLFGGAHNDLLWGGDGDDQLWGGTGGDVLVDLSGRDLLVGQSGNDLLITGEFERPDVINADLRMQTNAGEQLVLFTFTRVDSPWLTFSEVLLYDSAGPQFIPVFATNFEIPLLADLNGDGVLDPVQYLITAEVADSGGKSFNLDKPSTVEGVRVFFDAETGVEKIGEGSTGGSGSEGYFAIIEPAKVSVTTGLIEEGLSVDGDSGVNILPGTAGNDYLFGDAGNDTLTGNDGNDILNGGSGKDTMNGGAGNDILYFSFASGSPEGDVIDGGAGLDTLRLDNIGIADDIPADAEGVTTGVTFDLGSLGGGSITGIEILDITGTGEFETTGSAGNFDVLSLTGSGDNTLVLTTDNIIAQAGVVDADGHAQGDPQFDSATGVPTFYVVGDAGDTVTADLRVGTTYEFSIGAIPGFTEFDIFLDGTDTLVARLFVDTDVPIVIAGPDTISDLLIGDNVVQLVDGVLPTIDSLSMGEDNIFAGIGDDVIFGDTLAVANLSAFLSDPIGFADDVRTGTINGDDLNALIGAIGEHDNIVGGQGDDIIFGQGGDDVILGNFGDDIIWGGSGEDIFIYGAFGREGADVIKDFTADVGAMVAGEDILRFDNVLDINDDTFFTADDVPAAVTTSGSDITITFDSGSTILLEGLVAQIGAVNGTLADLEAAGVEMQFQAL